MEKEYYIIVNDNREGPLTVSQLAVRGIEPSTLVWTAGLSDWTRADCIPELAPLLSSFTKQDDSESAFGAYARPQQYENLNPAGNNGSPYNRPNQFGHTNQYGNHGQGYGNHPAPLNTGTNWKTLAIIALVLGFLFSCIGGIIGIFAVVAANKAENAMRYGDDYTAQSSMSNCKTLTIISFVLTGIGIISSVVMLSNFSKLGLGLLSQ